MVDCPKRKVNDLTRGEDDIFGTKGLDGKVKGSGESTTAKEKVTEVIGKVCKIFCMYLAGGRNSAAAQSAGDLRRIIQGRACVPVRACVRAGGCVCARAHVPCVMCACTFARVCDVRSRACATAYVHCSAHVHACAYYGHICVCVCVYAFGAQMCVHVMCVHKCVCTYIQQMVCT